MPLAAPTAITLNRAIDKRYMNAARVTMQYDAGGNGKLVWDATGRTTLEGIGCRGPILMIAQ